MKTIIYTHPYENSFNHAIMETVKQNFEQQQENVQVIDLYQDNFDPVMTPEELKIYSTGKTSNLLVQKYQQILSETDELVFVFPIWWHNYPAMLKGFIDKVMLHGFAYDSTREVPWEGLLTYINKVTVITTSTARKEYLQNNCGDPIQGVFINRTLDDLGITPDKTKWIHYEKVDRSPRAAHEEFLQQLSKQML